MTIFFKITRNAQLFSIEAENLTLIKVALIEKYGRHTAFQLFQKELKSSLLIYNPNERDLMNLVKGNYKSYVSANRTEINKSINSIKEI